MYGVGQGEIWGSVVWVGHMARVLICTVGWCRFGCMLGVTRVYGVRWEMRWAEYGVWCGVCYVGDRWGELRVCPVGCGGVGGGGWWEVRWRVWDGLWCGRRW